jgi:hypothetical protein
LDTVVTPFDDVDVSVWAYADVVRFSELPGAVPDTAPLAGVLIIGGRFYNFYIPVRDEALYPVIPKIGNVNVAVRPYGYVGRPPKFPLVRSHRTPFIQETARGGKILDAVIFGIRNENFPRLSNGQTFGSIELPVRRTLATPFAEEFTGRVKVLDAVIPSIRYIYGSVGGDRDAVRCFKLAFERTLRTPFAEVFAGEGEPDYTVVKRIGYVYVPRPGNRYAVRESETAIPGAASPPFAEEISGIGKITNTLVAVVGNVDVAVGGYGNVGGTY